MNNQIIEAWRQYPANVGTVAIEIDVAGLNNIWARSSLVPIYYIPTGGHIRSLQKYINTEIDLNTMRAIRPPQVEINSSCNSVIFINGRHRFAVMRDRGIRTLPIHISMDQISAFASITVRASTIFSPPPLIRSSSVGLNPVARVFSPSPNTNASVFRQAIV
jgi:hypothetical protein